MALTSQSASLVGGWWMKRNRLVACCFALYLSHRSVRKLLLFKLIDAQIVELTNLIHPFAWHEVFSFILFYDSISSDYQKRLQIAQNMK